MELCTRTTVVTSSMQLSSWLLIYIARNGVFVSLEGARNGWADRSVRLYQQFLRGALGFDVDQMSSRSVRVVWFRN